MAGGAGGDELLVQCDDRSDVAALDGSEGGGAGIEQELRVVHPLGLIARPAWHHEEIGRLRDHERLAFEQVPLGRAGRGAGLDVEEGVHGGVEKLGHEIAHASDGSKRWRGLRRWRLAGLPCQADGNERYGNETAQESRQHDSPFYTAPITEVSKARTSRPTIHLPLFRSRSEAQTSCAEEYPT